MSSSKRRNVLLIMCDQLRPDFLHAYGADFIPTPNLDFLASQGTTFDNAITASTVCAPARASFITGLPVSGHGAWTNNIPCKPGTVYLPERMNEAGYLTGAVGCYDHAPYGNSCGYKYTKVFDEDPNKMAAREDYMGYLTKKHPDATSYYMREGDYFKYGEEDHYDRWSCDCAVEFLESYAAKKEAPNGAKGTSEDSPFFLYCGFLMPHGPYLPPKEVADTVDVSKIPEPVILERAAEDIPAVERYRRAFLNEPEALKDPRSVFPQRMKLRKLYCEMIVEIDRLVGRLIDTLKEQGLYENTTIIFTGDHGSAENDWNISTKGPWPYTPQLFISMLIANHPELVPGSRSDVLCGNLDIGGTVLDIAGDKKAFGLSRSMIGMATGRVPERSVNMSEFCDSLKNLVDKRYTFSYYPFTGKYTLFDRIEDPHFTKDLAHDPAYAEVVNRFLMKTIDFMVLAKGVRMEAHDLNPEVVSGLKEMHPAFLDDFTLCYPLASREEVRRVKEAGLDADYNEFCKERKVTAHYGVYWE